MCVLRHVAPPRVLDASMTGEPGSDTKTVSQPRSPSHEASRLLPTDKSEVKAGLRTYEHVGTLPTPTSRRFPVAEDQCD